MYRLALFTGRELWVARPPPAQLQSFSDGGVSLSADGRHVYSCSNLERGGSDDRVKLPGDSRRMLGLSARASQDPTGGGGVLRAYRVDDGALVWSRTLPLACNSFPAAAENTVIVPTGAFVGLPTTLFPPADACPACPSRRETSLIAPETEVLAPCESKRACIQRWQRENHELSLSLGEGERAALGHPALPGAILAFDPASGEPQWSLPVPPITREAAVGDEEGVLERLKHDPARSICLPAQWGAAIIAGDGAVYVPRSDGLLYVVRPPPPPPRPSRATRADVGYPAHLWLLAAHRQRVGAGPDGPDYVRDASRLSEPRGCDPGRLSSATRLVCWSCVCPTHIRAPRVFFTYASPRGSCGDSCVCVVCTAYLRCTVGAAALS